MQYTRNIDFHKRGNLENPLNIKLAESPLQKQNFKLLFNKLKTLSK